MKNVVQLLSLLFFLGFYACNDLAGQYPVGKIVDGKPVLTIDEAKAKANFENFLEEKNKTKVRFDEVKIVKMNSTYVLLGHNKSIRSAFVLTVEGDVIYERKNEKKTITCAGCTSGCSPYEENGIWECKVPCDVCKKTETVEVDGKISVLAGIE